MEEVQCAVGARTSRFYQTQGEGGPLEELHLSVREQAW
jgi:hypothetical protein